MSELLVAGGRSAIVWVEGSDAVAFLDGLLSQSIAGMATGSTGRSLLLAPNGKLRATLFVLRGEDRVGLVCDAGVADVVAGDLNRFKIRVDAELSVDRRPVWEFWGQRAEGAAGAILGDIPLPGTWAQDEQYVRFYMAFWRTDTPRVILVGNPAQLPELSPEGDLEAFRIAAGEPVMGVDLDDKTIPQEGVDVALCVDFSKGCYLGQELVARIDSRGHVNRRLAGLVIAGRDVPAPGVEALADGRPIGVVTSAVRSAAHDRVMGLAMIRREVDPGTAVTVAGAAAEVKTLPMSF